MPRSRPLLAGALLATSFSVDAQPSPGLRRIGFVGVDSTLQARTLEALLEGLRALGYVDDKAIVIDITKHRRGFLGLLAAARLPAACEAKHYVIDGCLMSYGASYPALVPKLRALRRPHSERRQACRTSRPPGARVRARHQSEDLADAWAVPSRVASDAGRAPPLRNRFPARMARPDHSTENPL